METREAVKSEKQKLTLAEAGVKKRNKMIQTPENEKTLILISQFATSNRSKI